MVMFIIQYNYIDIFMQDFVELSYCGILSTFYVVGFCPVGFCPVGFCPGFPKQIWMDSVNTDMRAIRPQKMKS